MMSSSRACSGGIRLRFHDFERLYSAHLEVACYFSALHLHDMIPICADVTLYSIGKLDGSQQHLLCEIRQPRNTSQSLLHNM